MPKAVRAKEEFLPDVSLATLEEMHRREKPGKSRDRLQAAKLRKRGDTLEEVADVVGKHTSTISRWLNRMESEGVDAKEDRKSPGRPRNITPEQERAVEKDLDKPPGESGFDRGGWNHMMPARHVRDTFDVACSPRTALRVADRLGFSFRKARTIPYNSATAEEREKFIEGMGDTVVRWKAEERVVLSVDATTLRDSPTSGRGLRRRGGRDAVRTNYSKRTNHLIGALGDGTLDARFHENLTADSYVSLLEYARRRHKKIGVIIPQRRRPHRQSHAGIHRRNERRRRNGAHPAPHPAAQPHRDAVAGDQGRHRGHLLRGPRQDAGRHNTHAPQQGDIDSQIVRLAAWIERNTSKHPRLIASFPRNSPDLRRCAPVRQAGTTGGGGSGILRTSGRPEQRAWGIAGNPIT